MFANVMSLAKIDGCCEMFAGALKRYRSKLFFLEAFSIKTARYTHVIFCHIVLEFF